MELKDIVALIGNIGVPTAILVIMIKAVVPYIVDFKACQVELLSIMKEVRDLLKVKNGKN